MSVSPGGVAPGDPGTDGEDRAHTMGSEPGGDGPFQAATGTRSPRDGGLDGTSGDPQSVDAFPGSILGRIARVDE
jgi:hypothetical protein